MADMVNDDSLPDDGPLRLEPEYMHPDTCEGCAYLRRRTEGHGDVVTFSECQAGLWFPTKGSCRRWTTT